MFLGACRRRRRRGGFQLYQLRAAWGATGQLSGIRLGLWVCASGGAAQSASMFISSRSHGQMLLPKVDLGMAVKQKTKRAALGGVGNTSPLQLRHSSSLTSRIEPVSLPKQAAQTQYSSVPGGSVAGRCVLLEYGVQCGWVLNLFEP